jgi:hypothetical protein
LDSSNKTSYFSRPSEESIKALNDISVDIPEDELYRIGNCPPPQMWIPDTDPKEVPLRLPYTEIDICSLRESKGVIASDAMKTHTNDISASTWKKIRKMDRKIFSDKKEKEKYEEEWRQKIKSDNAIIMNKTFQAMNIVEILGAREKHVYDPDHVYDCIGSQIERTGFLVSEKHGEDEMGAKEEYDLEDESSESEEDLDDDDEDHKKEKNKKKKNVGTKKEEEQMDEGYEHPKGMKKREKKPAVDQDLPLIPKSLRDIAEEFLYPSETDAQAIQWRSEDPGAKYVIDDDDRIIEYKELLSKHGGNVDLVVIKYGNLKIFTNIKLLLEWDETLKTLLNRYFPLMRVKMSLGAGVWKRKPGPKGTYSWSLKPDIKSLLEEYVKIVNDTVEMFDTEITYEEMDQVSF